MGTETERQVGKMQAFFYIGSDIFQLSMSTSHQLRMGREEVWEVWGERKCEIVTSKT